MITRFNVPVIKVRTEEGSDQVERWPIDGTACVENGTVGRGCIGDVLV